MGWIWNSGCSWFDGALVDDGDDGTEGETGDEVSFGEVAMGSRVGVGVGLCCLGAGHGITGGIGRGGGTWE